MSPDIVLGRAGVRYCEKRLSGCNQSGTFQAIACPAPDARPLEHVQELGRVPECRRGGVVQENQGKRQRTCQQSANHAEEGQKYQGCGSLMVLKAVRQLVKGEKGVFLGIPLQGLPKVLVLLLGGLEGDLDRLLRIDGAALLVTIRVVGRDRALLDALAQSERLIAKERDNVEFEGFGEFAHEKHILSFRSWVDCRMGLASS